jgi:hypothetical protein
MATGQEPGDNILPLSRRGPFFAKEHDERRLLTARRVQSRRLRLKAELYFTQWQIATTQLLQE